MVQVWALATGCDQMLPCLLLWECTSSVMVCGSDAPASLLAFAIMHGNPKFVASLMGLCGCMVFCSGGDVLSERPTWQGNK